MGVKASHLAKNGSLAEWSTSEITLPNNLIHTKSPNTDSGRCSRSESDTSLSCNNDQTGCHHPKYGYLIPDVNDFLSKATLSSPGNIPMVVLASCPLYMTEGGFQEERLLPARMVVNALFKKQAWVYVQTPRGDAGYASYSRLAPMGILGPCARSTSWESAWSEASDSVSLPRSPSPPRLSRHLSRDVLHSHERLDRRQTHSHCGALRNNLRGDYTLDRIYARAIGSRDTVRRQTLLVVTRDFLGRGSTTLTVKQGEVVALIHSDIKQWFWVRNREGQEGFIPAEVAGNGFL